MMREVTVALDGGRRVRVDLAREAPTQPVVPAYAHHVAAFQGGELAVPIVSPSRTATRNSGYTALTRARDDVHIVIDRETYGERAVDGLIRDWSRTVVKRTAWSQLDEAGRECWAAWNGRAEPDVEPAPEPVVDETEPEWWATWTAHGEANVASEPKPTPAGYECTTTTPARDDEPAGGTSDPYVTRDMRRWARDHADDVVPKTAPAETHRAYADDGSDIGERARRGAAECEARLRDLKEIRAALDDLRDAGRDRDDEADRREAEESLAHDDDIPSPEKDDERALPPAEDLVSALLRGTSTAAPERGDERALPAAEDLVAAILRGNGDVPGTVRNRATDDLPAVSVLDMLDRVWSDPWVNERERDDEREREL